MANDILEFDFKTEKKSIQFFKSVLLQVVLISSFMLFGSYQNPDIRINNQLVNNNIYQLKVQIQGQLNSILELDELDTIQNINHQINKLVVKFYTNRDFEPAWTNLYSMNNDFKKYLNLLDSAKYYGFPFDYFGAKEIKNLYQNLNQNNFTNITSALTSLEITTTFSAIKYLVYLNHGIVENDTTQSFIESINTLPDYLNQALNKNNLISEFTDVQPKIIEHQKLLNSLPYFIDLILSFRYTTPAFIDEKLLAKSLYYTQITKTQTFDSINTKAEALYKLQSKYGLAHDSILNKHTHVVLVALIQQKYYQACLNINRLRRLNHFGENYLFVNIPEFKLHVIEANAMKEEFNVVVGKKETPTPTLSSSIEKVVANPYWTVPPSIVNNEMIYKIRKDSTYLKRNGYYVINNYEETVNDSIINWNDPDPLGKHYWIRQKNSRNNALGQVKFIFPNNFSVYLHDTPSKALFGNKYRAYSHGCIRLENPDKLAQYLTNRYYSENIDFKKIISKNEHQVVDLQKKINIYIQYITCSVNENNELEFLDDIYNLDQKEITEIFPDQFEI